MNTFELSSIKVRDITNIQFGILNPDEVRSMSVVEVKTATAYEKGGIPKENGLLDLRMGTTDEGFLCQSCQGNRTECPGHFGHVELARPMFHIGFLGVALKILRCVCFKCSRLLADPRTPQFAATQAVRGNKAKFEAMYDLSKAIGKCGGDAVFAKFYQNRTAVAMANPSTERRRRI
ncbi:DNA-directed RNA polymerase II subunit rpb1, variant 2 [Bonamia ostreae]|uniref:DNA-directed RNA polymerase n=1 Tax=Bonamia ostreae TaxID=126728 RepID=A0ABV2AMQ1_9EUKA